VELSGLGAYFALPPDVLSQPGSLGALGLNVPWAGQGSPAQSPVTLQDLGRVLASTPTAQALKSAVTLPGDVYAGRQPMGLPSQTEDLTRVADLAGLAMTGGVAGTGPGDFAVGSGPIRALPRDNYTKPLSTYTDRLYRETSPVGALEILDPNTHVGHGLGRREMYVADTPDLAIGQGSNKGVHLTLKSDGIEGQISKKPGWEPLFEQGAAEYVAYPKGKLADNVTAVRVDKEAAGQKWQLSRLDGVLKRLESAGWEKNQTDAFVEYIRKYGLAGVAALPPALQSMFEPEPRK
jgi:hypothetical protein